MEDGKEEHFKDILVPAIVEIPRMTPMDNSICVPCKDKHTHKRQM